MVFTFLLASFLGLVLGGSSRYLGFGRNSVHPVYSRSPWLVFVFIGLWAAAPFIEVLVIGGCVVTLNLDEDMPFTEEVLQYLGVALGLVQGCLAFVIGWLAGPEADAPQRACNPFQDGVPPVFPVKPANLGIDRSLDFTTEQGAVPRRKAG